MRMNGDQKGRARKMVAVSSGWVAPALSGALCAALGQLCMKCTIIRDISIKELAKRVPPEYRQLVATLPPDQQTYTVFVFPGERVIKSRIIEKTIKEIPSKTPILALGYNFTMEAVEYLRQAGIKILSLKDYPWTDKRYTAIKVLIGAKVKHPELPKS